MNKPFANQEYIVTLYENGFTNGFNFSEAFYIAKYFYWIKGFGKQKTKKYLINYCIEQDSNFNPIPLGSQLNNIVLNAMKKRPSENKDVVITKKEIEIIEGVKNYKDQKILFSLLVAAKRSKFDTTTVKNHKDYLGYHLHYNSVFDIFNRIGMNLSFKKTMDYIGKFFDINLIEPTGEFLNILYANDNSQPLIEVLGTENPWDKFNEYNGGEYIYCSNCGDKFFKKSEHHNNKYCEKCRKEKTLEKHKKYNIKRNKRPSETLNEIE